MPVSCISYKTASLGQLRNRIVSHAEQAFCVSVRLLPNQPPFPRFSLIHSFPPILASRLRFRMVSNDHSWISHQSRKNDRCDTAARQRRHQSRRLTRELRLTSYRRDAVPRRAAVSQEADMFGKEPVKFFWPPGGCSRRSLPAPPLWSICAKGCLVSMIPFFSPTAAPQLDFSGFLDLRTVKGSYRYANISVGHLSLLCSALWWGRPGSSQCSHVSPAASNQETQEFVARSQTVKII